MRCRLPIAVSVLLTVSVSLLVWAALGPSPSPVAAAEEDTPVVTEEAWKQKLHGLTRGMAMEQVQDKLKVKPRRIARQLLQHRYLEQWFYDVPFPTRLDFDCRQGEAPFLAALPPEGK